MGRVAFVAGREGSWNTQREKLHVNDSSRTASTDPVGCSGVRIALQNALDWTEMTRSFCSHMDQSLSMSGRA